jgi:Cytochrome c3
VRSAIVLSQSGAALWFGVALLFLFLSCVTARAQAPASSAISLPTELRVKASGWWPTKGDPSRGEYAGSEVCFECHETKAEGQQQTAMFHAASRAADSKLLQDHPALAFQTGPFHYRLSTQDDKSTLTVSSGASALGVELLWAFGSAHMGQTFLYEQNGAFFESHVSFFAKPQALDITPGQSPAVPESLAMAAGRAMRLQEARQCFACHTMASTTANQFEPGKAILGVNCESCHGPAAKHVAAANAKAEKRGSGLIFNPANLSRVDSVDFCGTCHRTWQDVVSASANAAPVVNVRFAPYRLENSKCWAKGDARIACIGCHDPHQPLVHDLASYDSNCLQCHVTSASEKRTSVRPGPACPVAKKNCVSCHMPKVEPSALHSSFTDHWIRIAKSGAPYPE